MKKIGIIIALALVITVSGAYATWNYTVANGNVENAEDTVTIGITAMTETELQSGTITIKENTVGIEIDDDGSHNANLKLSGRLVITFSGNSGVDTPVKGLNLKCSASDNCGQYNGADVFKYTEITADREVGVGTDQNAAYAEWVIEGETLKNLIALNGTVSAPTAADYNNLKTAISNKTITVTVSAVS